MSDNTLLTPVEAAIRLGVSPELLFHYARRETQTILGSFRLIAFSGGGQTLFPAAEVDAFDRRLSEQRSRADQPRAKIDPAVTAHLKVEAGGACGRCGSGIAVENAHITPYRVSQCNHHRNLVRLCSACHKEFDLGALTLAEMQELKERLAASLCDRVRASGGIVLVELPPRRPMFGRTEETVKLTAALQTSRSLMVRGVGGIGKTQLVLASLAAAQTGRPVVWVALEDCPSTHALRAYIEAASHRIAKGQYLETLAANRACVVLDGIESAGCGTQAVGELIESLSHEALDIQVVVTSQTALPERSFDLELELGRLPPNAAARLLPMTAGSDPDVAKLLRFADGHPLSLNIVASLLRHFRDAGEVARRLLERTSDPLQIPSLPVQSAASSLDICLSAALEALLERERAALWVLAQFPAGLATIFIDLHMLGFEDSAAIIAELRRWHLVDARPLWGGSLLAMLSPVRSFVRRSIDGASVDGLEELSRRTAYALATRLEEADHDLIHGGSVESGMALFDRELPNALAVMSMAADRATGDRGYRAVAGTIAARLQTYLFSSGAFDIGSDVMRTAADLAIAAGEAREALEMLAQLQSLAQRAQRHDLAEAAQIDARSIDCGDDLVAQGIALGIEAGSNGPGSLEGRRSNREERLAAAEKAGRSHDAFIAAAGGHLTHRAALALLQQACLLEDAGQPGQALPLLDRASDYFRSAEDPINLGSSLQRRGNCLAYADRNAEAMDSYCESAAYFHRLEAVEYRSNSLGEAGLLIANHPDLAIPSGITRDVLIGGVDDILDRIVEAMPGIKVPGNDWPYVLTRKTCGIIALATLSGFETPTKHLADRLRNEVAEPLLSREPAEWRAVGGGSLVTAHFSALAWLCEHVASIDPVGRPADSAEVEGLAIVVEDTFRGDDRDTMFSWLARYLGQCRGMVGLRPGVLRAAVDGLAYGDPFLVDGFDLP